ncbi:MAG: sulfatase-like hydrolase/transferase [Verrucomicrobiaceae bacterium]|nr:sulfatase-like hydrolase/transferase [Verrucomicrobiaceae bacterium]
MRFLLAILFPSLALLHPSFSAQPNVLFIRTNNHGASSLGCYGNKDIHTPNLDRLGGEGVRFEKASSNNPVCSPTRETWLTGLTPRWKYVRRIAGGPAQEHYDLAGDPDELTNLAPQADEEQCKVITLLDARLTQWFGRYRDAQWDLRTGGSTQGRVTGELAKYLEATGKVPPAPAKANNPRPQAGRGLSKKL